MQRKPSEIFEGENSSLRKTYEEITKEAGFKLNNMQRENKWQDRFEEK